MLLIKNFVHLCDPLRTSVFTSVSKGYPFIYVFISRSSSGTSFSDP